MSTITEIFSPVTTTLVPATLHLRLAPQGPSIETRVALLIEKMLSFRHIPEALKKEIEAWREKYFSLFFEKSIPESAQGALGLLLIDILALAKALEIEPEAHAGLDEFEAEIKALLSMLISKEANIDTFLVTMARISEINPSAPLQAQINQLLIKMLKSSSIPSEMKDKIRVWTKIYLNSFEAMMKEKMFSDHLCFLLEDILYPLMEETASSASRELLAFEDSIKSLLSKTLPEGIDVEAFIESHEQYADELAMLDELEETESTLKDLLLDNMLDATQKEQIEHFESVRKTLLELIESGREASEEVYAKLNALSEKIKEAFADVKAFQEKNLGLGMRLAKSKEVAGHLLKQALILRQEGAKK